jgi:sugar phosphate isomerase/epimerase
VRETHQGAALASMAMVRFTHPTRSEYSLMASSHLDRRAFLQGTLIGGAALGLGLRPARAADVSGNPPAGKIGDFKISLAEWSLHNSLFRKEVAQKNFGQEITNLDFPRIAREQYGIEGVEFVNQFFKTKAHDSAYLKDLKTRADDQGVTCVLIMIDGNNNLSAKEPEKRNEAVEFHKQWVDAAAALGCHSIRVNTGSNYSPTDVEDAAQGCGALVEYGAKHKINIICENHGGPSSNPDALLALIRAVNSPYFGTLPDFGNFEKDKQGKYTIDIYDAIARMMPYAKGVSAKSYNFNEQGKETVLDYARIMKIVTDSGYHGFVGIEYEGSRLSEPEGIRATKKLLESLRGSTYSPPV